MEVLVMRSCYGCVRGMRVDGPSKANALATLEKLAQATPFVLPKLPA